MQLCKYCVGIYDNYEHSASSSFLPARFYLGFNYVLRSAMVLSGERQLVTQPPFHWILAICG